MSSYKVVPFIGRISTGLFSSDNANTVARQLEAAIEQNAADGWSFHTFAKAAIEVQPGCIASLLGARTSYIAFDQLVFVRAGQPNEGNPREDSHARTTQGVREPATSRMDRLLAILASEDAGAKEAAIIELCEMGRTALPALSTIEALKQDSSRAVRQRAAWATEELKRLQSR